MTDHPGNYFPSFSLVPSYYMHSSFTSGIAVWIERPLIAASERGNFYGDHLNFLGLPTEIQFMIYGYFFHVEGGINLPGPQVVRERKILLMLAHSYVVCISTSTPPHILSYTSLTLSALIS